MADKGNQRVQVFTAGGESVRVFGSKHLSSPLRIALDVDGYVYVTDEDNYRIFVFNSKGSFKTTFYNKRKDKGEWKPVHGLAVDDSGIVYACDRFKNSIQLF